MLLSVIMPVYNANETIGDAVKSVLQQSFADFELILVNDGSTDSSAEICDLLVKTDQRVKVVHQKNQGIAVARNQGMKAASGKFYAFIDSDDRFDRETFLNFYEASIQHSDMTMYVMNFDKVYGKFNVPKIRNKDRVITNNKEMIQLVFTSSNVAFYTWNKIYHNSLFRDIQFPEGKFFEDIVTTYKLAKISKKTVISNRIGYHYIRRSNTTVSSSFSPNYYDIVTECERLYALIKVDFPELQHLGLQKFLESIISAGYKLSQASESIIVEEFQNRLRKDIQVYQEDIDEDKKVPLYYKVGVKLIQSDIVRYKDYYKKNIKLFITRKQSESEDEYL